MAFNATLISMALADYKSDLNIRYEGDNVFCISCDVKMTSMSDDLFECPICEQQFVHQCQVAVESGGESGHVFRGRSNDYRIQQIQNNKTALIQKNRKYEQVTGRSGIPEPILEEAARLYSTLQVAYYNLRQIKFVRRGKIKDQILACLIHKLLKKKGLVRQRAEISSIFELEDTGFSVGETQVQELERALGLDLIHDQSEIIVDLATRYLRDLDLLANYGGTLNTPKNLQFVIDIVIRAEVIKCGICCYLYSRVAGSVYILTRELSLNPKNKIIEQACDSCKKNTFERFKKIIQINYVFFRDIIESFPSKKTETTLDTRRLPHLYKYIEILKDRVNIPEIKAVYEEMKKGIDSPEGLPDDYDPYVDSILRDYDYPDIN